MAAVAWLCHATSGGLEELISAGFFDQVKT
jgi:hypothetical protein